MFYYERVINKCVMNSENNFLTFIFESQAQISSHILLRLHFSRKRKLKLLKMIFPLQKKINIQKYIYFENS